MLAREGNAVVDAAFLMMGSDCLDNCAAGCNLVLRFCESREIWPPFLSPSTERIRKIHAALYSQSAHRHALPALNRLLQKGWVVAFVADDEFPVFAAMLASELEGSQALGREGRDASRGAGPAGVDSGGSGGDGEVIASPSGDGEGLVTRQPSLAGRDGLWGSADLQPFLRRPTHGTDGGPGRGGIAEVTPMRRVSGERVSVEVGASVGESSGAALGAGVSEGQPEGDWASTGEGALMTDEGGSVGSAEVTWTTARWLLVTSCCLSMDHGPIDLCEA